MNLLSENLSLIVCFYIEGRWKENVRMRLKEIGTNSRYWVESAQDREYWRALANGALNHRVP